MFTVDSTYPSPCKTFNGLIGSILRLDANNSYVNIACGFSLTLGMNVEAEGSGFLNISFENGITFTGTATFIRNNNEFHDYHLRVHANYSDIIEDIVFVDTSG